MRILLASPRILSVSITTIIFFFVMMLLSRIKQVSAFRLMRHALTSAVPNPSLSRVYSSDKKVNSAGSDSNSDRRRKNDAIPKASSGVKGSPLKRLRSATDNTDSSYERKRNLISRNAYVNDISAEVAAASRKKKTASDWVEVRLGDEKREKAAEMEDRLRDAERWVSKRLTDEEAEVMNRAMGIDDELLSAMDNEERDSSSKRRQRSANEKGKTATREKMLADPLVKENSRIKGFLEINPYVCSGCGSTFQSKEQDSPGFLPKDKLQDHRGNAVKIREKQDAIRILELAGISLDSDTAEEILREANIPTDVIQSVRALGARAKRDEDEDGNNLVDEDDFISASAMSGKSLNEKNNEADDDPVDGLEIDLEDLFKMSKDGNEPVSIVDALQMRIAEASETETDKMSSTVSLKNNNKHVSNLPPIDDIDSLEESLVKIDSRKKRKEDDPLKDSICICQRCFRLQQYGQVEEQLRPGWSEHELLTPERFESLLSTIKEGPAIVLCIIDLFDVQGSLLKNLRQIAGDNPIVIAANKVDLLPLDTSKSRLTSWILAEVKDYCGLLSPREAEEDKREELAKFGWVRKNANSESGVLRQSNIHLVSCQSGLGVDSLIGSVVSMASDYGNKVYVMGAANVGKSSFINRLLENKYSPNLPSKRGKDQQKLSKDVPQATVSNLPGTTLDFIKIKLPNGVTVVDTPGLINRGQLTSRLTPEELRDVIPVKPINAVTLRVSEGKTVMVGGLATVELLEGRPFFFTFFVSNCIKLHPTDSRRVAEFTEKHIGKLLFPPATKERLEALGPFESQDFEIEGDGWKHSISDIVIAGLGWVAITGSGRCKVRVTVPVGTGVTLRPSLLPFEASHSTAKFTGGRIEKKSRKSGSKTYGWRA